MMNKKELTKIIKYVIRWLSIWFAVMSVLIVLSYMLHMIHTQWLYVIHKLIAYMLLLCFCVLIIWAWDEEEDE